MKQRERRILALVLLGTLLAGPAGAYRSRQHPEKVQVSRLPTCDAITDARIVAIDDGASATDCATGGGATPVLCFCDNGSGWSALGGGGVTDHGALTGLSDDDHPQYGQLLSAETVGGTWTFDGGIEINSDANSIGDLYVTGDTYTGMFYCDASADTCSYKGSEIMTSVAALTDIGDICAGNEILERNAGDTAWACIATPGGGSGSPGGSQYDAQYNDGASGFTSGPHTTDVNGDALFNSDYGGTGAGSNSIKIGDGAVNSANNTVAIGNTVNVAANANTVAIGALNDVTANNVVSIGYDNDISGQYSSGVGGTQDLTGDRMSCLGYNCDGSGGNSIGLGNSVQLDYANSGAFGRNAATTAVNQLVFGSDLYRFRYIYFGGGASASDTTASSVFLYATSYTGTNKKGGSIVLSGGIGTGNADSGEVHIRVAAGGTSGSSQNATGTVMKWYAASPGLFLINPIVTAPSCAVNGDMYVDSSGALCFCDGSTWYVAAGGGSCT